VRATSPGSSQPQKSASKPASGMSLETYLKRRDGGSS
jgi:hypothetical protein